MYKLFFFLALCALGTVVFWQNNQLKELTKQLDDQELQLIGLKAGIEESQTGMALLYRFSLANHRNILSLKRKKKVTVTAYSAREEETDSTPWLTATNKRARPGIVAVSRDLFDSGWVFGKQIYVKNHGVFLIDDLMHKRKTNQVDIFMLNPEDAQQFGRQELDVYLLETPAANPPQEEAYLKPTTNLAYAADFNQSEFSEK